MPNHCSGTLYVRGKEKRLKEFIKFAKSKDTSEDEPCALDAENFIPYPQEVKESQARAREHNKKYKDMTFRDNTEEEKWHKANPAPENLATCDLNISLWGTKWGFYDISMEDKDIKKGKISYYFDTAWSPIIPVIEKMAQMNPDLKFEYDYEEPGCDFAGNLKCANGEVIEHNEETYTERHKRDDTEDNEDDNDDDS